jgi:long-chain-fatty-acid--CoA ligase ACSBG
MCSSYLPLSHIAAQLIDIHCVLAMGGTTYFAQPDALKVRMKYLRLTLP